MLGKFLSDPKLKIDLVKEFSKFTTAEMLSKIKDCASSQMAECFFLSQLKWHQKIVIFQSLPLWKIEYQMQFAE